MVERQTVEIGGRKLSISNLDKVLYPVVGFTKAQVIDYYVRIAPYMLPHLEGRALTMRRWPNGVNETSFFEKRSPTHRPDWISTVIGPERSPSAGAKPDKKPIEYTMIDEIAGLAWTANLAAIELHTPMSLGIDADTPTMVVFDLDPGSPATIIECCQVALEIREVLDALSLEAFAKTSGSKGMQLYVPLNSPHTQATASSFAHAVAQLLQKQLPKLVVSQMTKSVRKGKVFIDWSQNSRHKTTITPYSMRAKDRPTVSTPLTWDEVAEGANGEPLTFETAEVLERVEEYGDLFEPTQTLVQQLPSPQ